MPRGEPVRQVFSNYLQRALPAGALSALRALARAAADIVFPPACLCCRQATETPGSLCASCWSQVRFIERPFCDRLGTPFVMDLGNDGLLSPEAVSNPPVFDRARAVAHFDDGPVRQLVHRLKYYDRMELAKPLGSWMARAGSELLAEAELLVPIPLHRRRLAARKFNQANALARVISAQSGVPADPFVLERVKATPPQVGLSRTQRALNLQGAFRIAGGMEARIAGRAIVLIDDVMTSGATLNAASRVLLRGGAKRADVLVFARTV
ncbi:MAG: ComF family protein [Beijerinckiaceae bacterium]|nr:ComF family protein [Beijerinckiaceae bacterium]